MYTKTQTVKILVEMRDLTITIAWAFTSLDMVTDVIASCQHLCCLDVPEIPTLYGSRTAILLPSIACMLDDGKNEAVVTQFTVSLQP